LRSAKCPYTDWRNMQHSRADLSFATWVNLPWGKLFDVTTHIMM